MSPSPISRRSNIKANPRSCRKFSPMEIQWPIRDQFKFNKETLFLTAFIIGISTIILFFMIFNMQLIWLLKIIFKKIFQNIKMATKEKKIFHKSEWNIKFRNMGAHWKVLKIRGILLWELSFGKWKV